MSDEGRDRAIQLVGAEISVDFTKHILLFSVHKHEQKDSAKRQNCNRHSQLLERSQLSDERRDRANQLVVVDGSVDFTKHTLLFSVHEHEQKDSAQTREL